MRRFSCLHMIATWPWLELPLRIAQISLLFGLVTPSPAQVLSPLYNFNGKNTSAYPVYGAPAQGRDGKMYGTASGATNTKGGAVFALTIKGVATFPHTFSSDTGSDPFGGVILAADGAMYGTTGFGGSADSGVLFRIGSDRVYSILHEFQGGTDGALPGAAPVVGLDGNLYGTTNGNATTASTVYKYVRATGTFVTLYQFDQAHGVFVTAPLIQGTDGNLYGTAYQGGANNCGTVFKLNTSGTLLWFYSFPCGQGGANPVAPLLQASDGNFYGTTSQGGNRGVGTVFKMDKNGVVSILYNFQGSPDDGADPFSGLMQATDGNLYGTTSAGGISNIGAVFQITTTGSYRLLSSFTDPVETPVGTLAQHTNGLLYGTTESGGKFGFGTVYSLDMGLGPFITLVRYQGKIGATAQILGQGFAGTTSITFNGVAASSFKVVSDTYMTAVVPTGAKTGPVVVTSPSGKLTSNKNFRVIGAAASGTKANSVQPRRVGK